MGEHCAQMRLTVASRTRYSRSFSQGYAPTAPSCRTSSRRSTLSPTRSAIVKARIAAMLAFLLLAEAVRFFLSAACASGDIAVKSAAIFASRSFATLDFIECHCACCTGGIAAILALKLSTFFLDCADRASWSFARCSGVISAAFLILVAAVLASLAAQYAALSSGESAAIFVDQAARILAHVSTFVRTRWLRPRCSLTMALMCLMLVAGLTLGFFGSFSRFYLLSARRRMGSLSHPRLTSVLLSSCTSVSIACLRALRISRNSRSCATVA